MRFRGRLIDVRPLRVPAFRRLWTASAVTALGGSFTNVALPVQLYAVTGSSAYVGIASAASTMTLAVTAVAAGVAADRVDRRQLLMAGNALLGAAYAGLWLVTVLGVGTPGVLVGVAAVQGVALGTTMTASGAVVPRLIRPELLAAASSLSSLTRYAGAVVGPLLAGALIPRAGLGPLYLCDALALLAVMSAVARLPALGRRQRGDRAGPWTEGLRLLVTDRLLLAVVLVDLAAMVLAMPSALFPELAARTYGDGSLGLLYAAYPTGVLAGTLVSGSFTCVRRPGVMMAGAALAWGGCVVLLGLAPDLPMALAALVVGGAVNLVLSTTRNAITQAHTDDTQLGRVQGALVAVLIGGPSLGNVLHGVAGAAVGPRPAIVGGGLLTAVVVAVVWWLLPALSAYAAERVRAHQPCYNALHDDGDASPDAQRKRRDPAQGRGGRNRRRHERRTSGGTHCPAGPERDRYAH